MLYRIKGNIMDMIIPNKYYNIYNIYDGPEIHLTYNNVWEINMDDNNIMDYISDSIELENLDKSKEYIFIYLNYKNINMVNYFKKFGTRYKKLIQLSGPEINEIEKDIPIFTNMSGTECLDIIEDVNNKQKIKKVVFQKGFILEDIETGHKVGTYTTMFNKINNMMKRYNNKYEFYLHLYQNNLLNNYISYISNKLYSTNIINRINRSIKCISNEILNIYFLTNNRKNPILYHKLRDSYKNILYQLKSDYRKTNVKINIHVIYSKLKNIDLYLLKQIIFDRQELIKINEINEHFDRNNYDLIILNEFLRK